MITLIPIFALVRTVSMVAPTQVLGETPIYAPGRLRLAIAPLFASVRTMSMVAPIEIASIVTPA